MNSQVSRFYQKPFVSAHQQLAQEHLSSAFPYIWHQQPQDALLRITNKRNKQKKGRKSCLVSHYLLYQFGVRAKKMKIKRAPPFPRGGKNYTNGLGLREGGAGRG